MYIDTRYKWKPIREKTTSYYCCDARQAPTPSHHWFSVGSNLQEATTSILQATTCKEAPTPIYFLQVVTYRRLLPQPATTGHRSSYNLIWKHQLPYTTMKTHADLLGYQLCSVPSSLFWYHIAQTIVAKMFRSFPVSMIVSTKTWKLAKCGLEPMLSHVLFWDHTWEMEGHNQSAWSTSSNSLWQWSQQSSDSTIRGLRLCFVGIEFLMALHKKFQTLAWTCIPHTFFHSLLSSGWYSPLSKHIDL